MILLLNEPRPKIAAFRSLAGRISSHRLLGYGSASPTVVHSPYSASSNRAIQVYPQPVCRQASRDTI